MIFKSFLRNSFIKDRIISTALTITIITFVAKLFGYVEKLLLAYYFGTNYEVDVYTTVFVFITSIFIFIRELIEPGFLRVFSKTHQVNQIESWTFFNSLFILILILTGVFSFFALMFPEIICNIISPGFTGVKRKLMIEMLQLSVPACIFYSLSSLTNITLNSFKKFLLPTLGDLVLKIGLICGLVLFYQFYGIKATVIGIFIGCFGRLLIHLLDLFRSDYIFKTKFSKKHYLEFGILTWPLILGVSFSQFTIIIDNILGSYLMDGSISALSYAKKVVEFPLITIPSVISIIIFPYLSNFNANGEQSKATIYLNNSIKFLFLIFIPITFFFTVYSKEIIEIIYQRGAFKIEATLLTANAFRIYSIGILFMALETVLVIYYYSIGDTKTPIIVGIITVFINLLIAYSFIHYINYLSIALGLVVAKIIKNIYLLYNLYKKDAIIIPYSLIFKIMLISCLCLLISIVTYFSFLRFLNHKIAFLLASFIFAGIFIISMKLLKIRSVFQIQ